MLAAVFPIFHLEGGVVNDKNEISQDGRFWPANHLDVTRLDGKKKKKKNEWWRVTHCSTAAYRQSVPCYNMCVNDNAKGYCHASLATPNTLSLWKLADH